MYGRLNSLPPKISIAADMSCGDTKAIRRGRSEMAEPLNSSPVAHNNRRFGRLLCARPAEHTHKRRLNEVAAISELWQLVNVNANGIPIQTWRDPYFPMEIRKTARICAKRHSSSGWNNPARVKYGWAMDLMSRKPDLTSLALIQCFNAWRFALLPTCHSLPSLWH